MIDVATGANAVIGILAALAYRDRVSHEGQFVDVSMLGTAIAAQAHLMTDYLVGGRLPARTGNGGTPTGRVYQCEDGPVLFSARSDEEFRRLCALLDAPELAADARFATSERRRSNSAELISRLEPLFSARKKSDVVAAMQRERIPGAIVQDYSEVFSDPQVIHEGVRIEIPHPMSATGHAPGIASPIRLSETPAVYGRHPPTLGEHTDAVLREVLNYDEQEITRLRGKRCI